MPNMTITGISAPRIALAMKPETSNSQVTPADSPPATYDPNGARNARESGTVINRVRVGTKTIFTVSGMIRSISL